MKGQKNAPDSLEMRRYSCAYEKEDILCWKQWIVEIEKPMQFVLIASIISGGILTVFSIAWTFLRVHGMYYLEIFLFQIVIVIFMSMIMCIGTKVVLFRYPRPPLERCLEVEYCDNSVKLYYLYKKDFDRKGQNRQFIEAFAYDGIEIVKLGNEAILINGRKIQLEQPKLENLLSPIERCKYQKYFGYLQGIHNFHYDFEAEKLIGDIYFFRDAMQIVHNREKKE